MQAVKRPLNDTKSSHYKITLKFFFKKKPNVLLLCAHIGIINLIKGNTKI